MVNAALNKFIQQDNAMRAMFAQTILEDEFLEMLKTEPLLFNETLALAGERNWAHPRDLAIKMNMSESNTRKWFKTSQDQRSTPKFPMMRQALLELASIVNAPGLPRRTSMGAELEAQFI